MDKKEQCALASEAFKKKANQTVKVSNSFIEATNSSRQTIVTSNSHTIENSNILNFSRMTFANE